MRAFRFAAFELNLRTRRLTSDGSTIGLTNCQFNLLAAMLAAPQRVLTRSQLIEASRLHDNELFDRSIDVQILRLRRKIESDPREPICIVTELGVGYSLTVPVEKIY